MLFILVMDVLNSLVRFATEKGLLQPLAVQCVRHRVSFYADDAVIFLRPAMQDLQVIKCILEYFGHASGLQTNLAKSSASPIHCSSEALALTADTLSCEIKELPCTYLGLPLCVRKPTKDVLLPLIDNVADHLPGWKASLMNRAGRLILVRVVLTAITIHHLIALDLPKWVIKAIDKRRRGFLWKGQEQANGVSIPTKAWALFEAASCSVVGNGESIKFWTDRWLDGRSIVDLVPSLLSAVPRRAVQRRTMAQALQNQFWVSDISGALTVQVLVEDLRVWELVDDINLQQDVPDQHLWKLTKSGIYSRKSAYTAFFLGSVGLSGWKRIWKGWAPLKCKFFLWLVKHNRCWTPDHLAKRGLPHPLVCPFCDQADETIHHILVGCVFSRQVWTSLLHSLTPSVADTRFFSWWARSSALVPKEVRKALNTLFILVAWELWKFRNSCVFEGCQLCVQWVIQRIKEEGLLWCKVGASILQEFVQS
ncbi:hypothetical protein U9M48_003412 [Paspalum notatum var. saurae]|uniref:Reverse transcriptase zinc-binding domain-containing protein n=1 Tax=Paspalum notatum var. saurae TaxID=547442 RepID=A0AAQ3PKZ7_PASNO